MRRNQLVVTETAINEVRDVRSKGREVKLSKRIPARTKTIRFNWCVRNFLQYRTYRQARERSRMKITKGCEWCGAAFGDDDQIALAQPDKSRNMLLCDACAVELLASED